MEDLSNIKALIDTSVKINIMIRQLIEEINLALKKRPRLKLVSYTGHSRFFLEVCEDIKVAIEGLKIRHPIFVIKS